MGTGSCPRVKRLGRGVDHPPPSSTEVKERVELYIYSPSAPSWPVLRWTLPLPFHENIVFSFPHVYFWRSTLTGKEVTWTVHWLEKKLLEQYIDWKRSYLKSKLTGKEVTWRVHWLEKKLLEQYIYWKRSYLNSTLTGKEVTWAVHWLEKKLLVHWHITAVYRSIDRFHAAICTSPVHLRNARIGSAHLIVYLGLFPRGQSDRGIYPTTQLHQVPKLRISGAVNPLPHMLSWRTQGLYLLWYR
jgi:hypothetical protein